MHFEDEVDDSDPRLGIPSMTGEEKKIAERYHRRRSPMPFVINRTCVTSRNEKSKTNSENRQSRSDNRVSVLCTPRDRGLDSHLMSVEFKHVNGAMNGDILKAESQQVLYPMSTVLLSSKNFDLEYQPIFCPSRSGSSMALGVSKTYICEINCDCFASFPYFNRVCIIALYGLFVVDEVILLF